LAESNIQKGSNFLPEFLPAHENELSKIGARNISKFYRCNLRGNVIEQYNEQVELAERHQLAVEPMIDLVDIKRDIETLGDRLGKTQEYL
jgi:hypothetical protein